MVIADCGIIVEDTCDELHQAYDVIGGVFEEDATDCHVAIPCTKLIR